MRWFVKPIGTLIDALAGALNEAQGDVMRKRQSASLLSLACCKIDWTIADETALA